MLVVVVPDGSRHHRSVGLGHGVYPRDQGKLDADHRAVSDRPEERVREPNDSRGVPSVRWRHRDDHPLQQLHLVVRAEHTFVDEAEVVFGRPARRCSGVRGGGRKHRASVPPAWPRGNTWDRKPPRQRPETHVTRSRSARCAPLTARARGGYSPDRMAPLLPTSSSFLRLQGERRGAAGGLVFSVRRIAWCVLSSSADDLAGWLARRGVGAGQHVGVTAANDPALLAMLYALWGVGAVAVPIGVRATAAEMARLLAHSRGSGLLADSPRAELARDAAAAVGLPAWACRPELPLTPRLLRRGRARSAPRSRLASIAYTSGTPGAPKGVMLTHENFLWATLACGQARGDTADSIGACLSPLTHVPVLVSHLLCRVLAGSGAVLFERFELGTVLEAVERHGITDLPLIGGMVFDVVQAGGVPEGVRGIVRKVSVGGAPTPMEAKRALGEIFAGAEVIEAYGQTESTDGVTMARAGSVFVREGTVGRMNPYVVVAVGRADGALAAPGEEGEVVIGGPTGMAGYYRDPPPPAAAPRGCLLPPR